MSSIQELKVVRAFRALNTMIQLCHDRGYIIRHPSAIADAVQDPAIYDSENGLDYDWFLRHFVVTPDRAAGLQWKKSAKSAAAAHAGAEEDAETGAISRRARRKKDEENAGEAGDEELVEDAEMLRRAANGEWICMRNAMRLSCSVDPAKAGHSPALTRREQPRVPAAAAAAAAGFNTNTSTAASAKGVAVKKEEDNDDNGDAPAAAARAAAKAAKNALMVFFSGESKLTVKEVQACREKAMKKRAAAMIIVANKVDPSVRMDIQELSGRMNEATGEPLLSIQVFEEETLAFNVVHHETVPKHVALTPAEAEAFLAAHKLSISQLPRMLESDPLVQYLGLQRGSIVHITREGKQSGPYSMYRHVI